MQGIWENLNYLLNLIHLMEHVVVLSPLCGLDVSTFRIIRITLTKPWYFYLLGSRLLPLKLRRIHYSCLNRNITLNYIHFVDHVLVLANKRTQWWLLSTNWWKFIGILFGKTMTTIVYKLIQFIYKTLHACKMFHKFLWY